MIHYTRIQQKGDLRTKNGKKENVISIGQMTTSTTILSPFNTNANGIPFERFMWIKQNARMDAWMNSSIACLFARICIFLSLRWASRWLCNYNNNNDNTTVWRPRRKFTHEKSTAFFYVGFFRLRFLSVVLVVKRCPRCHRRITLLKCAHCAHLLICANSKRSSRNCARNAIICWSKSVFAIASKIYDDTFDCSAARNSI